MMQCQLCSGAASLSVDYDEVMHQEVDVIVIGAGIAGITAARILDLERISYVLLESRDRVGGRIHSVTLPAASNQGLYSEEVIDLGANYLIGCSPAPHEQPCFHLAHTFGCKSITCAGDVHSKYRGWECLEVSEWRDADTGELISPSQVKEAVYLLDKVQDHVVRLWRYPSNFQQTSNSDASLCATSLASNTNSASPTSSSDAPPFSSMQELFDCALKSLLQIEHTRGYRSSPELGKHVQGIYQCLLQRYLGYVNPLTRLSASLVNEFYPRPVEEEPNFAYPSAEQRATYDYYLSKKEDLLPHCKPAAPNKPAIPNEDRLVLDGFSQIPANLAERLHVHKDSSVSEITWQQQMDQTPPSSCCPESRWRITVRVRSPPQSNLPENVYHARYCIITVPVGVLKHCTPSTGITFQPQLPQKKLEAIHNLGIPHPGAPTHNKVILRYRPEDVFWNSQVPHLDCPQEGLHFLNLHFYGKLGVIVAHLWGSAGIHPFGKTNAEVVGMVRSRLEGMYRSLFYKDDKIVRCPPLPVQSEVTRWSEDEHSLGAYTAGELHSTDADRRELAASVPDEEDPVLLFAGEATLNRDQSKECTHGALLSGFDSAEKVVRCLYPGRRLPRSSIVQYLLGQVSSGESMITRAHRVSSDSSLTVHPPTRQLASQHSQPQQHLYDLEHNETTTHYQKQHKPTNMTYAEWCLQQSPSEDDSDSLDTSDDDRWSTKRRKKSRKSKKRKSHRSSTGSSVRGASRSRSTRSSRGDKVTKDISVSGTVNRLDVETPVQQLGHL